jgi:hypothetical protein
VTGEYNYEQDANRGEGSFNLELDQTSTDLTSPIAEFVDGRIHPASFEIVAINGVVLTLDPR